MENGAGEDLSWFWKSWFYNNWKLDLALLEAKYVNQDPKNGIQVTIINREQMAMPASIEVKFKDGTKERTQLPVETWLQNKRTTFIIPTTKEVANVTIDPDNALPDLNRGNNAISF
jgi:hypothetical protein